MLAEVLIYTSAYIGIVICIFYTLSILSRRKKPKPVFPEKNPPFISIVIPAYNEEKGIAASIESALSLEYPRNKMEIIVVNDGSKDNTLAIAKKYESSIVRVFSKSNGGKGSALNYGIQRAKGEFIFTTDADSRFEPKSAKNQIALFSNPKVMCVSPVVVINKPRNILERVQQIEYLLGVFLREAFAGLNAIHITPGAFSAYRKSFFDKYGGFHENNLTEDMEIALRIQANNFLIEHCMDASVYTTCPRTFKKLLVQRRRWYSGLITNLKDYSHLFSKKYDVLGLIVLPMAVLAILTSLILSFHFIIRTLLDFRKHLALLDSINFNILSTAEFTKYTFKAFWFDFFSDPMSLFVIVFIIMTLGYMFFAKSKVKKYTNIALSLPLFLLFYSILFTFWWVVSIIYKFLNKKVVWR